MSAIVEEITEQMNKKIDEKFEQLNEKSIGEKVEQNQEFRRF